MTPIHSIRFPQCTLTTGYRQVATQRPLLLPHLSVHLVSVTPVPKPPASPRLNRLLEPSPSDSPGFFYRFSFVVKAFSSLRLSSISLACSFTSVPSPSTLILSLDTVLLLALFTGVLNSTLNSGRIWMPMILLPMRFVFIFCWIFIFIYFSGFLFAVYLLNLWRWIGEKWRKIEVWDSVRYY